MNDDTPKAQHTPGPWKYDGGAYVIGPHDSRIDRCPYVAGVWEDPQIPNDQKTANGLILSAAPEMLEALEDVSQWAGPDDYEPWANVRAVIDKAKGH